MTLEIMERNLCGPTTHDIQSALSLVFYDENDELQVFSLNQKTFIAKQSGKSLSKFYKELVENFQEFNHCDKVVIKDVDNIVVFKKSIDRLKVHIFLAGLDGDFEQIYKKILLEELVPNQEECYFFVRHEVVHHNTLKGKFENPKVFAMMAINQSIQNWSSQNQQD